MSKKKTKVKAEPIATKRQLSKWQRQQKTQRIIIVAAIAFLAGIFGYVGFGHYTNAIKPLRAVVIEVNETSFNMGYYVNMLDARTRGMDPNYVPSMADVVAGYIEDAALMQQGANALGITVTNDEINDKLKTDKLPSSEVYRDVAATDLLMNKLLDNYFDSQLPDSMDQAHVQLMLVESQKVANNVTARIESGEDFLMLVEEFSLNPDIQGDLGWLPPELIPSPISNVVLGLEPGEVNTIPDSSAVKDIGYWLIKITEKDENQGIYAQAMLLSSEEEAEEVQIRLDTGEDFAELAKNYSQHESRDKGGEIGWVEKGDMGSNVFDEVAFDLELNEVSQPIRDNLQTNGGYWAVEVLDRGEHQLSDEVRQTLKSQDFNDWLLTQRTMATVNNYLDEEKTLWAAEIVIKRRQ